MKKNGDKHTSNHASFLVCGATFGGLAPPPLGLSFVHSVFVVDETMGLLMSGSLQ